MLPISHSREFTNLAISRFHFATSPLIFREVEKVRKSSNSMSTDWV